MAMSAPLLMLYRPRRRLNRRRKPQRPKCHRLSLQELASAASRRDLPQGYSSPNPARVRWGQVDAAVVERRTLKTPSFQLLPPVRHHLPHQPVALMLRVQQDELQQSLHLLPASDQDRCILLPVPHSGLAQLLARLLDREGVFGRRGDVA